MTHPVRVLHAAAGGPPPNWQGKARTARAVPEPRSGVCALTCEAGPVWPARHVISDLFTQVDQLPFRDRDPAGLAFGEAAAWAIRCRPAMQLPHAIVDGRFRAVAPSELHAALVDLAANPAGCVSVPQSRQKHLIPWARLGQVGTDSGWWPWRAADVDRLVVYGRLREIGFGEVAIAEPAPRWAILSRLDGALRSEAVRLWPALDPWRAHTDMLDVAARATRQDKTGGSDGDS